MVTRGQYLERATLIPRPDGGVLEGLSHRGRRAPPLLIVPPPPGTGGMDHPVGAELAWAVTRAGHATLRFNFKGVGASPGPQGGLDSQLEDAESAGRLLKENTATAAIAVAALGASAQTVLGLVERHPGLAGLALVSPVAMEVEEWARLRPPLLVVVGAQQGGPQAALVAAVSEAGGRLVAIAEADARFLRHLPKVGHAVAHWLAGLAASP
jgi:uncharacterized protein